MSQNNSVDELLAPLCVDLDGTLVFTDLLHENILAQIKKNPLVILKMFLWLFRGRAYFKMKAAELENFDVKALPFNPEVLKVVHAESEKRSVYLVTAAAEKMAHAIYKEIPAFEDVFCSSNDVNLKGEKKADFLVKKFGEGKFDYIGNDASDIPIFKVARVGYFASENPTEASYFEKNYNTKTIGTHGRNKILTLMKAMRIHQWIKNILIFTPIVFAHEFFNTEFWWNSLLSFVSFCLCASSVYVLNDLSDIQNDRRHHTKKTRAFASGELSIPTALAMAVSLLAASFTISFALLPILFTMVLAGYFIFTCLYSFILKEKLIIDAVSLALLYTIRIVAGHAATSIPMSHWLLAFSLFIFLSLAFLKRTSELQNLKSLQLNDLLGRAYLVQDLGIVQNVGVASGFISVLVFVLYLDSTNAKNLYHHSIFLTLIIPVLLYWIGRVWVLGARGKIHEDPIVWAIKDRVSHLVLISVGALFFLAQ